MAPKSVFSLEQRTKIVLLFGKHKSVKRVPWEFAKMYGLEHHPRSLPKIKAFKRVIDMISSTGSVLPDTRKGETEEKKVCSEDNIKRVRQEILRDKTVSIRNTSQALDLSYRTGVSVSRRSGESSPGPWRVSRSQWLTSVAAWTKRMSLPPRPTSEKGPRNVSRPEGVILSSDSRRRPGEWLRQE